MTPAPQAALMEEMHALLLLGLVLAAPKAPADDEAAVVVLVDNATIPAGAVGPLTEKLRREVEISKNYRWREPPPMSVDELILAIGCRKVDGACLKKMQDGLRVDSVVVVTAPKGMGSNVIMVMSQKKKGKGPRTVELGPPGPDLYNSAAKALRELLGPVKTGQLLVTSEPPGASVVFGGVERGQTPVTIPNVPHGSVTLTLTLTGFLPHTVEVPVEGGATAEVKAVLKPDAPVATPPPEQPLASLGPDPAAPKRAAGPAGLPMLVKIPLVGVGVAGMMVAVVGVLVGASALLADHIIYQLVWRVQSTQTWGTPLVWPLGIFGGGSLSVAVLLLPIGAAVIVGTVATDVMMRSME